MRILSVAFLTFLLAGACLAEKKAVRPKGSPAGRPFSPGILANGTLYVSGAIGTDAAGKVPANFEDEVRQCLENIGAVLKEAGMNFDNAVAVQVYLTDMALFQRMNAVYMKYFNEPRPARTTIGNITLANPAAHVEITVTAQK